MIDLEKEIYTRIWTLLNTAGSGFADLVPPGNQIRYDTAEGLQNPLKETKADGDYYEAVLYCRSGTDSLYTEDQTFETMSEDGPSKWTEKHEFVYRLVLTTTYYGVEKITNLCAVARRAIRRGKPTMGLSYVNRCTLRWEAVRGDSESDEGQDTDDATAVWKARLDIQVITLNEGSTLNT